MLYRLFIAFLIYAYFFCNLGNTCYRVNSDGIKIFNILPLFTEGIIGPIRSSFLLLFYNGPYAFSIYVFDLLFSLHNIYGSFLLVNYMYYVYLKSQ
jgi:hypothetical protein